MDATPGGMVAVSGIDSDRIQETLRLLGAPGLHLAALNAPHQVVLVGPEEAIRRAVPGLRRRRRPEPRRLTGRPVRLRRVVLSAEAARQGPPLRCELCETQTI
ncbi:hypothetical protein OG223_29705 [Streptomyces sp. NBC_01478]|uniref:hypothetical protein n=1 Tax=Streptomyces sp. NBC_01478 TaxID=2903882 RepID=UPI002E355B22|nr:hypothetical protein [Streptomyces sp. NBC_01478]